MNERRDPLIIAAIITLLFHAGLGGGLYAAGELIDRGGEIDREIEVEIVQPPPPPPPPPPPKVEPEPPKPPEPVKVEPKPKVRPKRVAKRAVQPPVEPKVEPAPGPVTNDDTPAPVVKMDNIGFGGSGPPVARGRPKTRKVGTGGDGTNTGGGGPPTSKGTGGPRPVSIASIKNKAMPLNADLDTSKLYTPEAKQRGVEGKIKVKLVVDETGKVTSRRLVTRLGFGLDQVALKLAKKLRFKPAIDTNNKPVASTVVWTFTFVLPK